MEVSRMPEFAEINTSSCPSSSPHGDSVDFLEPAPALSPHRFSTEHVNDVFTRFRVLEEPSLSAGPLLEGNICEAMNNCSSDSPDSTRLDDLSSIGGSSKSRSSISGDDLPYFDHQPSISDHVQEGSSSVGAGFVNLGNSCYMSSIMQCLTHTASLVQGLRSCGHKFPCEGSIGGFCILCVLHEIMEASLSSPGRAISPSKLFDNLHHLSSYFQKYDQEDAHEFLQCLLNKLETSDCSQDTNLVQNIFGGRLISKLRCCNCNRSSNNYESFIDLSLDIKDATTLQSALKSFTNIEKIGGPGTNFTCEGCKEESFAEKQFLLEKSPSVAAFHLKRFKSEDFHVEKIDKHVSFPLELDLQPYSDKIEDELRYELYGVVVHVGCSPNSGHYFCFIRSSSSWYLMDDSEVTQVAEEFVELQRAYIVFYAKKRTPLMNSLTKNKSGSPKSVLETVNQKQCAESPKTSPESVPPIVIRKHRIEPATLSYPDTVSQNHQSVDSSKRKEAMKFMRKTMPGTRRMGLMAAMMEPQSEGSVRKMRKRMISASVDDESRRLSCPGSLRTLA